MAVFITIDEISVCFTSHRRFENANEMIATVQPHGNVYPIRLFLEVNIPNRYIFQKYRSVLSHTNYTVIY
jgi:hypothetical protein